MLQKFVDETLEIFHDLPGHSGCQPEDLAEAESKHDGEFPPFYKQMMLLDEKRLVNTDAFSPVEKLAVNWHEAQQLLINDGHEFRIDKRHVVIGWEDIFGFYFMTADGDD